MFIARSPATCWQVFTDIGLLVAWVPGMRRAQIIEKRPDGLAAEASFEHGSLTYSLGYDYDAATHEVKWRPRIGARDAVRGFARFDECEGGTLMTYALEHGAGRRPPDTAIDDANALVAAFKRFVEAGRPSGATLRAGDATDTPNASDAVDHPHADGEKRKAGGETGEDVSRPVNAQVHAR
jgi:hypothetical protein